MKKFALVLAALLALSGCAADVDFETIGNVYDQSEPVYAPGGIEMALPDGATMEVSADESVKRYQLGDWQVWTEVHPGGDILATLETVTGLRSDQLTVMESSRKGFRCHETAWTTTAEEGPMAARTVIADSGNYHYCISMAVPEQDAAQLEAFVDQVLGSITITDTAP